MKAPAFLSRLLFPQALCLVCDEPRRLEAGAALCDHCRNALEETRISRLRCPRCLSFQSQGRQCSFCAQGGMAGIERAYAPFRYLDGARQLVLRLKFGPFEKAGQPLAEAMAFAITGQPFDYLVPVPLHPADQRQRGFNQAEMLCRMIQRYRPDLALLTALEKSRRTKRQSSLGPAERAKNVQDIFRAVTAVHGKNILLVDDVRTTGATARDCARALRAAGAGSVSLLTATVAD